LAHPFNDRDPWRAVIHVRRHVVAIVLFAALTVGWTWPLVTHLGDGIPGEPGDNFSFLWNLWWMRHVFASSGLEYFHTNYLFYPFGTTIADHPHTALPAFVAATVLRHASVITAQNVLLLAYVFANMVSAYALVWDLARHQRGAVMSGVIFGISPYVAAHLLGHYDLVAVWLLPTFALLFRRALESKAWPMAAAAGLVLAAAAYTAYYYVVYLWFFAGLYSIAFIDWAHLSWTKRPSRPGTRALRLALLGTAAALGAIAVWIALSGGGEIEWGTIAISARTPQNTLTAMWICTLGWALAVWRPAMSRNPGRSGSVRSTLVVLLIVGAVFALGSAPLMWQAVTLMAHGEYVTPAYAWRAAPRGIDLFALVLGPGAHPLARSVTARTHALAHVDRVEGVGWIGIVPALLVFAKTRDSVRPIGRIWRMIGIGFFVWALGPFLTIGGFDTGLKLPQILFRYVPFVANAHMPGRAMVGVFLALAVLVGIRMAVAQGRLAMSGIQWLLIGLVAFEYWDAPVPLTLLDEPQVYRSLAGATPGAVCEVPFGIGDGLSRGVGSQDRRILYYATLHEHPLVGGYIGRMPAGTHERYEQIPLTNSLLRLSSGQAISPQAQTPSATDEPPCRYLVVNRAMSSTALIDFIRGLPVERMSKSENRDLYRLK
jgi:hypothetical protein